MKMSEWFGLMFYRTFRIFFRYLGSSALKACLQEKTLLEEKISGLELSLQRRDDLIARQQKELEELERETQRLEEISLTDELTGLLTRRYLNEMAPLIFSREERSDTFVGVILIDLDHFKQVNDQCGHEKGDETLIRVAKILRDGARESDAVIRLGGDEFLIIATGVKEKSGLEILAARLCQKVRELKVDGCSVQVTFSIGICFIGKDSNRKMRHSPKNAIAAADMAMYVSKEKGRDCVTIVDSVEEAEQKLKEVREANNNKNQDNNLKKLRN